MRNKVRITCLERPNQKLLFVKSIKMASGLGLKEAKDIADFLFENLNKSVEIELVENPERTDNMKSFDYLIDKLPNCGGRIKITGGLEWERDYKMLTLGLGEETEYVDFVTDYLLGTNQEDILKYVLGKLGKNELIEIVNKIEI